MDSENIEPAPKLEISKEEIRFRRRTCVVCEHVEPVKYVTTFARNPDKQKQWIDILSNEDVAFAEKLSSKMANGRRKYLCLDHFARKDVRSRKALDGIEVIRNATPVPYKNVNFIKHYHLIGLTSSSENSTAPQSDSRVGKIEKLSSETANGPMKILIESVNFHVERLENEQS